MYLDQDSFDGGIYPIMSCALKYSSKSFSRNFLDLAASYETKVYPVISLRNVVNQSMQLLK
jgi:hypothetical protein